jgi:pimeloyl-ACP methyl ester carboxylesterase
MKNIILLHGALGTKSDLLPLKNILSPHFQVHKFNFTGHGNNTSTRDFTIEKFTEDLAYYINEHNIEKPSIFGYSMGGYVALNYALTTKNEIDKIFTLGTKFKWDIEFATKQAKFLNPEKLLEKVPAYTAYLEAKHHPNSWQNVVTQTANMMQRLASNPLLTEVTLATINTQTLIALGEKDDMVTIEESKTVAQQLPNATFKIIDNTPHPIEKVNQVLIANTITEFLS